MSESPKAGLMVNIYGLYDPRDGRLRYVGKTKFSIASRSRDHVRLCPYSKSHKNNWIASLVSDGLRPIASLIESVP